MIQWETMIKKERNIREGEMSYIRYLAVHGFYS